MSDVVEERRVFLLPEGEESELFVSREGPGVYRVQELLGFAVLGGLDVPHEAGLGWLLDVEELPDGRLRLEGIREEPSCGISQWSRPPWRVRPVGGIQRFRRPHR